MNGPNVVVSIPVESDFTMIDREIPVGHLRHVAILIGGVSLEVGAHSHCSDKDLVAFVDRLQVALSELRFAAVKRMTDHQPVDVLASARDDDHYAGRGPRVWETTPFDSNGHAG